MPDRNKPEVLVTGAAGVLAQQAISRLANDYNVVAIDFRRAVEIGDNIQSYKVDFLKRGFEDIFRKHDIKGIIHIGRIGGTMIDRFKRYNANVLGTQKMLDLSIKYGVNQVIILSSFFVYGASPYNPALLNEDTPLKASNLTLNLIDSVELENLAQIYLYKYPELNLTILRPCNIGGPGVRNNIGRLLSSRYAPVLWGFNPVMQFIHVEDMADAIVKAYKRNVPGIYNVAPDDWVPYRKVLDECGISGVPLPSIPSAVPQAISRMFRSRRLPSYLVNYFKYPVIIDGKKFARTFDFKPQRSLHELFTHYREMNERG
ncbi:MAG: NAD-dependent epimerase/dehydratase family protein [Desulfatibacillaceae bacterium]